ncbi:hypothetical protein LWI29_006703 [Acer saccharum]|uniref:Uncharacterized protein n=1 Tax=Acer saccharum TaxID=4024 RepID=A0AA39S0V6_ACESA|nr:hypothetical protein LWI29_006703 [Acer saccharum]
MEMEKNEQSGIPDCSSGKHEKHQPNDTKIDITQLEAILGASLKLKNIHEPVKECCIYKVPRDLRRINNAAYTPQVISIGPFHHGRPVLSEMENQKLIYMSEFLNREGAKTLKGFKRYIETREQIIRNHYQEYSSLASPKFVNMICDAVFIIELFLKNAKPVKETKFYISLDTAYVRTAITRDLQLLENQFPYFLLEELFEEGAFDNYTKIEYPYRGGPFLSLSHLFFFGKDLEPDNEIRLHKIQHFTDLRRYFMLMNFLPRVQNQRENIRDLPTATKLHGSGVKFIRIEGGSSGVKSKEGIEGGSSGVKSKEGIEGGSSGVKSKNKGIEDGSSGVKSKEGIEGGSSGVKCKEGIEGESSGVKSKEGGSSGDKFNEGIEGGSSLKISCELVPRFKLGQLSIPYFKTCELRIPCFIIDDWSECQYRNLMALELCHYPKETHICNFILLMNFLIDTEKDVDLLVDQKIIFSCLGDNNTVATLFNKLGIQVGMSSRLSMKDPMLSLWDPLLWRSWLWSSRLRRSWLWSSSLWWSSCWNPCLCLLGGFTNFNPLG